MLNHVDQIASAAFQNQLADLKTVKKVVARLKKLEGDALEKKRLCIKDRVEKLRCKIIRAETDYMHICKAKYEVENPDTVVAESKAKSSIPSDKKRKQKKPKASTDDEASGVENTDDERVEKKQKKRPRATDDSEADDETTEKKKDDKKKKKSTGAAATTSAEKKVKKPSSNDEEEEESSLQKSLEENIDTLESEELDFEKSEPKAKSGKAKKEDEEEEEDDDE
jgi:hypothetical protein